MRMASKLLLWLIVAIASQAGLPSAALAASFDCAKAATPVERLICSSPTLNALDEENAALYGRLIDDASGAERDAYRNSQRVWLKSERNRCATANCVALKIWQRSGMQRTTLERTRVKVSDIAEVAPNAQVVEQMLAQERKPAPAAPASPDAPPAPAAPPPVAAAPALAAPPAAPTPPPAPVSTEAKAPARQPKNYWGLARCKQTDLSAAQFQICDVPASSYQFKELDDKLKISLLRLRSLTDSTRKAGAEKVVAPAAVLWNKPEAACPALETPCLQWATATAARKGEEIAKAIEAENLQLQQAADARYSEQREAQPIVVTNSGGGNRLGSSGGYFARLSVENKSNTAYSEITVSCGLYERWGDEMSLEPEFNHTIRAGIAARSRALSLPYLPVPWNLSKWTAEIIKCRVLSTKEATAAEARAAAEKSKAEAELMRQQTQAAMKSWDEERERNQLEQSANQLIRLNDAIASFKRTPQCNAYGEIIAKQRVTVVRYQRAGQSAYPIVQSLINEARRMGCL